MTEMIKITFPDGEVLELPSHIDRNGVRRYFSNAVVDAAFDAGLLDLNAIAVMCMKQDLPLKDRVVFWSMLGYSVDGMCDLQGVLQMDDLKVETPEWTKDVYVEGDDDDREEC